MEKWTSGAAYDQWMGRWSRLLADEFLNWLSLPSHLRWLDLCCGSGVLTKAIVDRFAPARVAGVDASAQQIRFARAHRNGPAVSFETGDAMALPFDEASFDAIVCGLGLNYVPEAGRFRRAGWRGIDRLEDAGVVGRAHALRLEEIGRAHV